EEVERNRVKLRIYWIGSSSTKKMLSGLWRAFRFLLMITWQRGAYVWPKRREDIRLFSFLRKELITFVVSVVYLYSEKTRQECIGVFRPSFSVI
ncbi:MAG TPA: hypothetical protein PKN31_06825, partial [Candidatus Atribacteria bacterium]|nr:hypothetical protein [Candidatus Atribacteria bacterium]